MLYPTQMGSVIVYDPRSELYTYSIDPIKSIKEVLADTASGEAPLYGGTGFIPGSQKVSSDKDEKGFHCLFDTFMGL